MIKDTTQLHISESKRCLGCRVAHCKSACPVGNDIPAFLQCVASSEYGKAVDLIGHPFGEICGYVCPHDIHCHGGCVLSKKGQAVQMGAVERVVFAQHPYKVERKSDILHNVKVAVVGGGVAGLTFGSKMYEQGADVTVYERDELLSTLKLIPDFRLPREAIQRIERAIEGKFTVAKQTVTSRDLSLLQLDYDIVYVATGACKLYGLGVEGQELATPYDIFLKDKAHCGDVVVVGGGNTAMDCARLAKRNGCNVTVAYRRTRADMPAFTKEIDEAQHEGVGFVYNVAPVKLQLSNGRLLLSLAKTVSEGRGKLTLTDEVTQIACDTVVSALGSGFDSSIFEGIQVGDDVKHPLLNVYAGGDAVGGQFVARAVADAMNATKLAIASLENKK